MVDGYLPINCKDSSSHMHDLGLYVRDNLTIAREPSLEDPKESFMCFSSVASTLY